MKFFSKGIADATLALAALALSGTALAQANEGEPLRLTIGLKAWYNRWEQAFGGTANFPAQASSSYQLAAIPNLAINYRDFFASAGYFTRTHYDFPTQASSFTDKRSEYDINVGYWLLRGQSGGRLGVTLGYKQVDQYFVGFNGRSKAGTLGFVASAPIDGPWNMYANAAIGPNRTYYNVYGFPGTSNFTAKGDYVSGEAGIAYAIGHGTVVTAGYKFQFIDNNYVGASQRARDSTNGFIVGISHTF